MLPSLTTNGTAITPNGWQSNLALPQWLRLDLGEMYLVERYVYAARTDHTDGRNKDYEIYVSEVPLDESVGGHVNWDAGLISASGQFLSEYGSDDPANAGYQIVDLTPTVGQYVYMLAINAYGGYAGAGEVWVFGSPPGTASTKALNV